MIERETGREREKERDGEKPEYKRDAKDARIEKDSSEKMVTGRNR